MQENFQNTFLSWQDEIRHAFRDSKSLGTYLKTDLKSSYPVFIPPSLAFKIKMSGEESPNWKQFVPHLIESDKQQQAAGLIDPIGDHANAKGNGLIHRYNNRVLFTPTTICPVQCRYCFRKNELHNNDEIFKQDFQKALNYLNSNKQIEEIIFTGGDPLMLSDKKICSYLESFSRISHIKYIRFHTRMPVIVPKRLTFELYKLLQSFRTRFQINLVIHTNHIDEFDFETNEAIESFNISKLSQSVLLKGVNNSSQDLIALFRHLQSINVRPYYLHHPDKVYGGMHFYINRSHGQKIFQEVAKNLPGWMLPRYVVDPSDGTGKISAFSNI